MDCNRSLRTAGRFLRSWAFAALMFSALPAHAASVSFFLDQSNALPHDVNYLSVMLTENATGGVDFLVKTLSPLNDIAGNNFGIQKFGFNLLGDIDVDVTGLPDRWRVQENRRMDGYGRFDIRLFGNGKSRTESLSFTVPDISLSNLGSLFTAHVAGFEWCNFDDNFDEWARRNWCYGRNCTTSAFFAGTMPTVPSNVPLPGAVWMFGSGLIGLAAVARRKNLTARDARNYRVTGPLQEPA